MVEVKTEVVGGSVQAEATPEPIEKAAMSNSPNEEKDGSPGGGSKNSFQKRNNKKGFRGGGNRNHRNSRQQGGNNWNPRNKWQQRNNNRSSDGDDQMTTNKSIESNYDGPSKYLLTIQYPSAITKDDEVFKHILEKSKNVQLVRHIVAELDDEETAQSLSTYLEETKVNNLNIRVNKIKKVPIQDIKALNHQMLDKKMIRVSMPKSFTFTDEEIKSIFPKVENISAPQTYFQTSLSSMLLSFNTEEDATEAINNDGCTFFGMKLFAQYAIKDDERLCRNWFMFGKCRYKENCRNSHTITNSAVTEGPKLCVHFFMSGSCKTGDNCPNLHTVPAEQSEVVQENNLVKRKTEECDQEIVDDEEDDNSVKKLKIEDGEDNNDADAVESK